MKKILTILIAISSLSIYAQGNFTDASGKKQGKWVKKYESGKTRYTGTFKNDGCYTVTAVEVDCFWKSYLDAKLNPIDFLLNFLPLNNNPALHKTKTNQKKTKRH